MFVKRPVAIVAMSFFASFCLITNLESDPVVCSVASASAALVFFALSVIFKEKARVFARCVLIGALGALAASVFALTVFYPSAREYQYLSGERHKLEGTVTDRLWSSNTENCYLFDVSSVDGKEENFKAALTTSSDLSVGDGIFAPCEVASLEESGIEDPKHYYLSRGAILFAEADYIRYEGESSSPYILARKFNSFLSERLCADLGEKTGGVADAVLLGNRSGLAADVKRDFSRIGISHLVAISGMHVSFICLALTFMFRRFGLGKKKIALLIIPFMVFYMFLTGLSGSVVRAVLVCCAASLITVFGISYDGMTVLSLCGAGIVIADPFLSLSVALQLSFTACIGCLAAVSILKRLGISEKLKKKSFAARRAGNLLSSVIFTAVVVTFTLPLSFIYFDEISLITPLSNLLFIPLFSVILYLSALIPVFSPIAPVASAVSFVTEQVIRFALYAARGMASVRNITVSLKYPFSPYLVAAISLFIVLIVFSRKKRAAVFSVCLAVTIAAYGAGAAVYGSRTAEGVTLLRTGGSSGEAFIVSSGGASVLFDVSSGSRSAVGRGIGAMPELYLTELDAYIITDCSEQYAKTFEYVSDRVILDKVILLAPDRESPAYGRICDEASSHGIEVVEFGAAPDSYDIGNASIRFSVSVEGNTKRRALCFKVEGEKESVLYLGAGWKELRPNAVTEFEGADKVIFGSYGPDAGQGSRTANNFGSCKIYSFSDSYDVSGIKDAEQKDINSTLVLHID